MAAANAAGPGCGASLHDGCCGQQKSSVSETEHCSIEIDKSTEIYYIHRKHRTQGKGKEMWALEDAGKSRRLGMQ